MYICTCICRCREKEKLNELQTQKKNIVIGSMRNSKEDSQTIKVLSIGMTYEKNYDLSGKRKASKAYIHVLAVGQVTLQEPRADSQLWIFKRFSLLL